MATNAVAPKCRGFLPRRDRLHFHSQVTVLNKSRAHIQRSEQRNHASRSETREILICSGAEVELFDGQPVLTATTPAGYLQALTSWSLSLLTYKMGIIETYFLGLL